MGFADAANLFFNLFFAYQIGARGFGKTPTLAQACPRHRPAAFFIFFYDIAKDRDEEEGRAILTDEKGCLASRHVGQSLGSARSELTQ